jgi:hypothetical protein
LGGGGGDLIYFVVLKLLVKSIVAWLYRYQALFDVQHAIVQYDFYVFAFRLQVVFVQLPKKEITTRIMSSGYFVILYELPSVSWTTINVLSQQQRHSFLNGKLL